MGFGVYRGDPGAAAFAMANMDGCENFKALLVSRAIPPGWESFDFACFENMEQASKFADEFVKSNQGIGI